MVEQIGNKESLWYPEGKALCKEPSGPTKVTAKITINHYNLVVKSMHSGWWKAWIDILALLFISW